MMRISHAFIIYYICQTTRIILLAQAIGEHDSRLINVLIDFIMKLIDFSMQGHIALCVRDDDYDDGDR